MCALDLRTLFGRYRESTADVLLPLHTSNHLPEMACFDTKECRCLHYQNESVKTRTVLDLSVSLQMYSMPSCPGCRQLSRDYGYGRSGQQVSMSRN